MELKVGNWVTIPWHEDNEPHRISSIWEGDSTDNVEISSDPKSSIFFETCANRLLEECSLWAPRVDEWCWYKQKYFIQIRTINEDQFYFKSLNGTYINDWDYCICMEPFIGTLPSFIKDNK